MEVNEARRLKELEAENSKLKKLLADKLLEVEAMRMCCQKSGKACEQKAGGHAHEVV